MPFGVSWIDDLRHYATAEIRTAFDIGAHHGETAQLIGAAFPEVEMHCFEPVRPNYRTLLKTTSALPVTCVQAAVSDQDGTARFHLGPDSGRCGFRATGPGLDVRTVTLDSYARERGISHIDLLKIDTEGHEPAVLRGARELLTAGRIDFVLAECEFTERPEEPHGDFAEIVRAARQRPGDPARRATARAQGDTSGERRQCPAAPPAPEAGSAKQLARERTLAAQLEGVRGSASTIHPADG